ncbi:hypothetical protein TRFO_42053 [Tritrichomonas foetus]|uniref:Uncharacterized protein n=1 Tax=Tritrichomonas foetus TaxID=1144522 RepID=A0A1J4KXW6_9EUKA|nr:hypothetical protein TRFO_42053 [Tritrichomonas foetus]|eukprot:OHT16091.1 hypothetical protein TRFO_42053 [Tritrichomonas foetus]
MIIPPKSQSYALDPEIQKEILILRHDKVSCNVPLTVPILERDYFYDDDLSDDGPLNPNEYESDDKSIRKFYFNIVHHEPLYILIGSTATLKEKTVALCQKMRMSKKIKRLEDEVKYNKIEKNLQNKIFPTNIIQNSIQPTIPCNFHPDVNSFQKTLIYDFLKNLSLCFKKHNYGDITKELAFILSTYSHAGYQILRRFLPLPCDSVLYDNFGNSVKLIKEALTDMNQIETMLNFINYPKRQDQIRICLAVDAISFKLFSDCQKEDHLCEEDENPNNCENSNNFENLNDCENFNHENQLKPNDNSEYSTDFSFESYSCSNENEEELPLLCDSSKNDAIDLMLKILRSKHAFRANFFVPGKM